MCFAPQWRAIFRHQTFKKWSEPVSFFNILTSKYASRHSRVPFFNIVTSKMAPTPSVFFAFSLANVLRATAACHFSTSELQKWLRQWVSLCILTCKCASRQAAACHFSTSQLPKWLRECGVLCILTCRCASRHSGVPFFTCLPEQLPPHPPLYRGNFSNISNHESLKKRSYSRRP